MATKAQLQDELSKAKAENRELREVLNDAMQELEQWRGGHIRLSGRGRSRSMTLSSRGGMDLRKVMSAMAGDPT
jgi:hypothetical protein